MKLKFNLWQNYMNDELYNEIHATATILFRTYNSKLKGQQVSNMDNFDYWLMYVAYTKGEDRGYLEGYDDGTYHSMNSGREI
jgi:hypothetical protein